MKTFWIIGAGRFGRIALERLSAGEKKACFVIVDPQAFNLVNPARPGRTLIPEDGVGFMAETLSPTDGPDWIIPALPVHLAAQWCLQRLGPEHIRRVRIPDDLDHRLPNPARGASGDVYVSHADFICPDNCPEPGTTCTATGHPRRENMFDLVARTVLPGFRTIVIRSHQLKPGVGGYRPEQLFDLLEKVRTSREKMLVGTTCRCHGVITGIEPVS